MAVIKDFEKVESRRPQLHRTQVICQWSVVRSQGAGPILQLDTRGSAERENPGKLSQTLQLTPQSAASLFAILKREFHFA